MSKIEAVCRSAVVPDDVRVQCEAGMARSPRRISAQRRSRSQSRELTRLRTQFNGKGELMVFTGSLIVHISKDLYRHNILNFQKSITQYIIQLVGFTDLLVFKL